MSSPASALLQQAEAVLHAISGGSSELHCVVRELVSQLHDSYRQLSLLQSEHEMIRYKYEQQIFMLRESFTAMDNVLQEDSRILDYVQQRHSVIRNALDETPRIASRIVQNVAKDVPISKSLDIGTPKATNISANRPSPASRKTLNLASPVLVPSGKKDPSSGAGSKEYLIKARISSETLKLAPDSIFSEPAFASRSGLAAACADPPISTSAAAPLQASNEEIDEFSHRYNIRKEKEIKVQQQRQQQQQQQQQHQSQPKVSVEHSNAVVGDAAENTKEHESSRKRPRSTADGARGIDDYKSEPSKKSKKVREESNGTTCPECDALITSIVQNKDIDMSKVDIKDMCRHKHVHRPPKKHIEIYGDEWRQNGVQVATTQEERQAIAERELIRSKFA
eukprot:ANDGO_02358.mRNA.1 hypothetical protein